MIATPAGGWYVGVTYPDASPPVLVVVASSPGHPLQAGDRITPPPTTDESEAL